MIEVRQFAGAEDVATAGAELVEVLMRQAVAERGRFIMALSGGSTPWRMLAQLPAHDPLWDKVNIAQVDERVAPDGDQQRNLTHLHATLIDRVGIPQRQILPMPVGQEDLGIAALDYAKALSTYAGDPPVLDLVHLGLGTDGHTASLIPGDPALDVEDNDVAITTEYQGHLRMTLTFPMINRARAILWLVTGSEKATMLKRLVAGDETIPAGRVSGARAVVLADAAAAAQLES